MHEVQKRQIGWFHIAVMFFLVFFVGFMGFVSWVAVQRSSGSTGHDVEHMHVREEISASSAK